MRGLCVDCKRPAALDRMGRPRRLCATCQHERDDAIEWLVTEQETLNSH